MTEAKGEKRKAKGKPLAGWLGVFLVPCTLFLAPPAVAAEPFGSAKPTTKSADPLGANKPAEPPGKAKPLVQSDLAPEGLELIVFSDLRPVFLRLHVRLDGQAIDGPWEAYVRNLMKFLDADGDGVLNKKEGSRIPSGPQLAQTLQNGGFFNDPRGVLGPVRDIDAQPADGKITFAELAAYYRRSGAGPVQFTPNVNQQLTDQLTEALFTRLDGNKDGNLSKAELDAVARLLNVLDTDDDELVTVTDVLGNPNARLVQTERRMVASTASNMPFFFVPADEPLRTSYLRRLVTQLLARYDKDKNQKLSRTESALDGAAFAKLDLVPDGALDATELEGWTNRPADLELVCRLGKTAAGERVLELQTGPGRKAPLAGMVQLAGVGNALISLEDAQIDVRRGVGSVTGNLQAIRNFYRQQFQALDAKKTGAVELKGLTRGQAQQVRAGFEMADRDGNGMLTEKELNAYLDLQAQLPGCVITLALTDQGRDLFGMLDANRDGSLGPRELRTAWARVSSRDKKGQGQVSRTDIVRQLQVTVSRGQFAGRGRVVAAPARVMGQPVSPRSEAGPLWFRKMDRNGDGDVSYREFLGTRDDFRRLDTDRDGLLSPEEAAKAERK